MDRPAVRWFASAAIAGLSRGRAAIGGSASRADPGRTQYPGAAGHSWTVANRNRQTRCRRHYRNQGRTSQSPQGARGSWLIQIALITHGVVADRMTISQATSQAIRPVLAAA